MSDEKPEAERDRDLYCWHCGATNAHAPALCAEGMREQKRRQKRYADRQN